MQRKKRDKFKRAQARGYLAGVRMHAADICPHQEANLRGYWMAGWREGREHHHSSSTG